MNAVMEVVSEIILCIAGAVLLFTTYKRISNEVYFMNLAKVQSAVYLYKRACIQERRWEDYEKVELNDIDILRLDRKRLNPVRWKCSEMIDAEKFELIKPYLEAGDPNEAN